MKPALARSSSILKRLITAAPDAWRDDPVFRWSSIGAGACLLALVLNSGAKHLPSSPGAAPPALPPPAIATIPSPVPAPSKTSLPSPSAETLRIAPGRPLNGAVSTPGTPDTDRSGTLQPH